MSATASSSNVTNPKPRGLPVFLSVITSCSSTQRQGQQHLPWPARASVWCSPKPHRLFYYPKFAEMLSEVSCSMACTHQGGYSSRAQPKAWASMYSRANSLSVVAQLRPPRNNFDGLQMEVGAIGWRPLWQISDSSVRIDSPLRCTAGTRLLLLRSLIHAGAAVCQGQHTQMPRPRYKNEISQESPVRQSIASRKWQLSPGMEEVTRCRHPHWQVDHTRGCRLTLKIH